MSHAHSKTASPDVERWLAGAMSEMRKTRYFWFITRGRAQALHGRPIERLPPVSGDDETLYRFVTDARSEKVADLRQSSQVTLIVQNDQDDAYMALAGEAVVLTDEVSVRRHWREGFAAHFPTEEDRSAVAFVEVSMTQMHLWIRGITPEPFGAKPTILARDGSGRWDQAN